MQAYLRLILLCGSIFFCINNTKAQTVECPTYTNWQVGDFTTHGQGGYDEITQIISSAEYSALFASTFGAVEVGIAGPAGFSMRFGSTVGIEDYLFSSGTPATLTYDISNPTTTPSGVFGGEVLSLTFNVILSDSGYLQGNFGIPFGDLVLQNFTGTLSPLNGLTVREFNALANIVLGGGSTGFSVSDINFITSSLNTTFAYIQGVEQFAYDHLVAPCEITPINHCPVTTSSNVSTTIGTSVNLQLQASDEDNDVLTYSISQNPLHGTVTTSSTGAASYTPTTGYSGTDQFKFKASDGKCDAEATVNISIVVCPKLKGDWKNNPNAWPANATPMLLGTQSYTKNQLLVILNTPVGAGQKADASLILAYQLIAAKLNIANGTQAPASVTANISSADALIGGNTIPMKVKPNTALGKSMTAIASSLEGFNNGALSTGCSLNSVIAAASAQRGITSEEVMEVAKELEVKATPNPANNYFNVYVRSNNLKDKMTMQVMDMYERVIEVRNVNANSTVRFGDRYRPGTYFVRIIQGKEHKEIKLVKMAD